MNCKKITGEVIFQLNLSESEAWWLKAVMQNPIPGQLEHTADKERRENLFNLLAAAGVKA